MVFYFHSRESRILYIKSKKLKDLVYYDYMNSYI